MDRRNFITAASTAIAAGGVAAYAKPDTPVADEPNLPKWWRDTVGTSEADPHPEWLNEWRRIEKDWQLYVEDSPEEKASWAARENLSRKLANTQATTTAGLAAQFSWMKEDLGYHIEDNISSEFSNCLKVLEAGFKIASAA